MQTCGNSRRRSRQPRTTSYKTASMDKVDPLASPACGQIATLGRPKSCEMHSMAVDGASTNLAITMYLILHFPQNF